MKANILSLVIKGYQGTPVPCSTVNALLEEDVLQEAGILGVLHVMTTSTVAILFDLRTSLYYSDNTGLFILRGVSQLSSSREWKGFPHVWVVSGSETLIQEAAVRIRLASVSGGTIAVDSQSAEFITGFVAGIGNVASEIVADQVSSFLRTTPNWDSEIEVTNICSRSYEVVALPS